MAMATVSRSSPFTHTKYNKKNDSKIYLKKYYTSNKLSLILSIIVQPREFKKEQDVKLFLKV